MTISLSITIPAMLFFPENISLAPSYELSFYLFAGAMFYGAGAAINSACALGTLNQLMNGKMEYLGTIFGVATGFLVFLNLELSLALGELRSTSHSELNIYLLMPLMLLVWGIALFQIRKFTKRTNENKLVKLKQYLTSPVARDFISVSIFGFCSAGIYLLMGRSWDYTKFIMDMVEYAYIGVSLSESLLPITITTIALVSGMIIATFLSRNFNFQHATFTSFAIKFLAGGMMGAAVGLIPGGNDAIILYGIPGLALHAPIALMVMMMTIAFVVFIKKKCTSAD